MLYNKNNVRKTNDKKVLHKVGKQWKVVSIALLMAIGGGAAVATHANAQSNNGVNASTSAEVEALEQKPAVPSAVSSAPSSVAPSSASAKPSSAISYQNGYNGSAASYHAKAMSDNSGYKVNNATVQHYVNSLNAAFPSATNSLNNNYTSAATKTSADQAAAQSYSAIANNKNYSSQVSSLASKAGLTYSGFVQSVSYQASNFAQNVSYGSSLNSQMSTVNSYAQLINNIQSNSALSNEYAAKSVSASANYKVAYIADADAKSVYTHFINASAGYQNAINDVEAASASNSDAERIALIYAGLDAATTNSLAKSLGYANSSATSNRTHAIVDANASTINTPSAVNSAKNARISPFNLKSYAVGRNNADHVAYYVDVKNNFQPVIVAPSNANVRATPASASADAMFTLFSDTSQEDQYNAASAFYNSELASYASDSVSVSSAVNSASAALNSANNSLSSATSEYSATAVLGRKPTLSELFDVVAPSTDVEDTKQDNAKVVIALNNAINNALGLRNVQFKVNPMHIAEAYRTIENPSLKTQVDNLLSQKMNSSEVQQRLNSLGINPNTTKVGDALNKVNSTFRGNGQSFNLVDAISAKLANSSLYQQHQIIRDNASIIAKVLANEVLSEAHNNKTISQAETDITNSANNAIASVQNDNNLKNAVTAASAQYQKDANDTRTHNQAAAKRNHVGILPANSYGFAINALGELANVSAYNTPEASAAASDVNSIANNVASSFANVQSASNSYSAATEENVTLAGIYSTSYSNEANSDEAVESAAKNSLDNFYLNHADAKYANASSDAASFAAAEPNDAALAHANGVHVYNYAPKYVRVIRNGVLHSNTEYSKGSSIVSVPKGTQLTVLGVGFAQDGTTRYAVNYKGKKGYFTANVNYVTPAFLSAANGVSVTTNRAVKLYKNAKFTKKAGKTLPAGTTVPNVDVVSEDSIYGGFTRVETPSGDFFTANSLYVGLTGASANTNTGINDNNANIMNNTNNGANNGANNGVGFWK